MSQVPAVHSWVLLLLDEAAAAADKIEELVDRCARYAEEIAVLRQTNEDLRDTVLWRDT